MSRVSNTDLVAEDIRRKIRDGEWPPGHKLPSTRRLQEIHGVGNNAVYVAVKLLAAEGLIEGHQGKGRYVADRS